MGEISFLYQAKSLPRYEQAFRFWYSDTTKYSFAYQRYVTLSDTSIINSPVAITKVAAGLSSLYGLFVTNREPMTPDMLDGFNVYKNPKETIRHVYEQVRQEGHSMIDHLHELLPMTMGDVRSHFEIYQTDSHLHRYIYVNDNTEFTVMASRQNYREPMNIFNDYFADYDKYAKWYENIHAYMDNNSFNILSDILTKGPDIYVNYTDNIHGFFDDPVLNIRPDIHGKTHDFIGQMYDGKFGKRPDIIVNHLKQYHAKPMNPITVNWLKGVFGKYTDVYHLSKFPSFMGQRQQHIGNIFDTVSGTPGTKNVYTHDYVISGILTYKDVNAFKSYIGERQKHFGFKHKDISGKSFGKYAGINNQYQAKRFPTIAAYWDYVNCSVKEVKYGFYCNDVSIDYAMKYLGYHDDSVFGIKNRILGMVEDTTNSGIKDRVIGAIDYKNEFSSDGGKNVMTTTGVHFTTLEKPTSILYKNTFFSRNGKSSSISGQGEHVDKIHKSLQVAVGNAFINKVYKEMGIINVRDIFATKSPHDMRISLTDTTLFKDRKDLTVIKSGTNLIKERLPMSVEWESLFSYKVPKDMEILKISSMAYRVPYSMELYQPILSGPKIPYDLSIEREINFAFKVMYYAWVDGFDSNGGKMLPRGTSDFKVGLHALKSYFEANYLSSTDTALKDWLPLDLANTITKGYYGMIIPCSKVRVQSFVDDISEMAVKSFHNVFMDENCATSAIPKNVAIPDLDLFCDKDKHQVFIDNYNYWAVKAAIRSVIFRDEFVFKDGHKMSYLDEIWASKDNKGIYILPQYQSIKERIGMNILEQFFVSKDRYSFSIHDDFFVNKDNKMCYYYYDVIIQKERLGMLLQQNTIVERERYGMTPLIDLTAFLDSSVLNLYEPMMFTPPLINNLNLIDASNEIHRESYDVTEFVNDYGNWVWVYEPPDPFEHLNQVFGIDELLLPENDTRYEDFENIIFDKETLMPRDPVKMIDNTTFIARYPITHPIEDYADVGKIYDDSAQVWENYYGIETDVMHEVFLKYYQIWQARIFEFSTMTMQQSTKRMLDLLYTWITLYYPIEKMDQALRVFRQVRWYSESAIIRNSQYIISYEYDTLRSNLHKGTCDIPNDLDTNPTMYITQGVIRNNPAYLGQEASVEFTIETQKNTWFRFSLTNQIGTVKVYVNDVLVGMYPRSQIGITIELPYTTGTNCVKIVKEANHNIDTNFYIGNIEVPEASFKDLTIQFDPVLRAGNKPLDEVAKKLIAFANLHANRNEMYEMARRSNVGISETYKKMNEYWKNHHQNKSKGKRLTIKQL